MGRDAKKAEQTGREVSELRKAKESEREGLRLMLFAFKFFQSAPAKRPRNLGPPWQVDN